MSNGDVVVYISHDGKLIYGNHYIIEYSYFDIGALLVHDGIILRIIDIDHCILLHEYRKQIINDIINGK